MRSYWWYPIFRGAFFLSLLALLYFSQRFWFWKGWRLAGRVRQPVLRSLLRAVCMAGVGVVLVGIVAWILGPRLWPVRRSAYALLGLWLSSALFGFVGVKFVAGVEWLWVRVRYWRARRNASAEQIAPSALPAGELPDPERRYFFQTASTLAGALPFVGVLYGFSAGRLRYSVERVEVAIPGLPVALDGLRIAQLSDIHIGTYMPADQVRRAVEMANELSPDLAVVTGDFVTGTRDPLETCIEQLAGLRAPLGVWGCNGNHEIYAGVERYSAELFRRARMRLLRRENAELVWRGQPFNLIGVDYQRTRMPSGRRLPMLLRVESLVRRDVPNILLSHNPNAFPRAAELGIELTLAGHTHGGQVQVEILDHKWSPARFMTDFVAGLYERPLGSPALLASNGTSPASSLQLRGSSFLYVNRGLGTIGAPVRINAPPEITLLTLRRA